MYFSCTFRFLVLFPFPLLPCWAVGQVKVESDPDRRNANPSPTPAVAKQETGPWGVAAWDRFMWAELWGSNVLRTPAQYCWQGCCTCWTSLQRQCRQHALPGCGPRVTARQSRGLFKCLPSRLKSFRDLSWWFLQVQPSWLFVAVQGDCQMTLVVAVLVDAIVIIFIFIKLRNTCQGVI